MADYFARYISEAERDAIPLEDFGDPAHRDFPIRNQHDLDSAAHLIGKAGSGAKERIEKIATRKGLTLPEAWQEDSGSEERMTGKAGTVEQPTSFSFYAPFVRVADKQSDKREVVGKATRGTPIDTYGTVITYDASKKAFSRAKRIPLREMHQAKAVGKGLEWWGDDTDEDIFLHSYISRAADDTWTKVEEDILVGYSIKGQNAKYGTIQRDGKTIPAIVDYDLVEVSLVDNPSCPGCDIAIMRGDGIESVIASDAEMAEVLQKEQPVVTQKETPTQQPFERAGARISADTQTALHGARNGSLMNAKSLMDTCGCDQCTAASQALDPDSDGDIDWLGLDDPDSDGGTTPPNMQDDIAERVAGAMSPVYSRMQAYLGEFARRQSEVQTLSGAIERVTAQLERMATNENLDKVLAELAGVKGQIERVASMPQPGGPHTGRVAQKHLATDGSASPSAEEPDLLRQISQAGVNLTAQQQSLLVAGALKRM